VLDQPFVILDLETTGANPVYDRVTEVGLIEVERGRSVAEWSTLVNPGTRIPPAIQSLTGITDEMVALAPTFAEIAPPLLARLDESCWSHTTSALIMAFSGTSSAARGCATRAASCARSSCHAGSSRGRRVTISMRSWIVTACPATRATARSAMRAPYACF
jgi:hypothetical protein